MTDDHNDDPIPNYCQQCGEYGHTDEDPHPQAERTDMERQELVKTLAEHLDTEVRKAKHEEDFEPERIADELLSMVEDDRREDENIALWFTPQAIKDHFDTEEGISDFLDTLTDKEIREEISWACINSDSLYKIFHELLRDWTLELAWKKGVVIPGEND